MLKLTDIFHTYDHTPVLSGWHLTLEPGQRVAVMGASGVGKTTLLKIAAGLLKPDKGTVENRFTKTVTVFQEPRLLPWRTAAENVNLVLSDTRQTMPTARQWLEKLGMAEAADKYPRELSGGMQQRVALARALCCQGDLLLLDEPFQSLDATLQHQALTLVGQSQGAILLVTHERAQAEALGCRIVMLE